MSEKNSHLLLKRRFLPMFLTQFFGAFNDNVFKYALLTVFTYGWINHNGINYSTLNNFSGMMFILPFFLFSATAGQIADKYERAQLIRLLKIGEIIIMSVATVGFLIGNLWVLLVAIFLTGIQATSFGPIKYAILPEILKENELMSGNSLFQSATSLAILLGMLLGGLVISLSAGNMIWVSLTILLVACLGYLSSRFILTQPISDSELTINWNFFATSWQLLKMSFGLPLIFMVLLANSWYWFYGATLLTQTLQISKDYLHGNENVSSVILTFFSIGIVIGSALCKKFSGTRVNIKMVPIGAIGLSLFAFYLSWALQQLPHFSNQSYFSISEIFQQIGIYYHSFLAVTLLGISGGFYVVPLYAMMQAKSPESHRARIIAANNIFNAIFMVVSAIFCIIVLSIFKLSLIWLFMMTGVLNALITAFLIIKIKKIEQV